MPLADHLSQTATLTARRASWGTDGAEQLGTPALRAAGVPCLVVPESSNTVRVFFAPGTQVWQAGDQELVIAVGGSEYSARPDMINAALGVEYGAIEYSSVLPGAHVEVVAEVVRL